MARAKTQTKNVTLNSLAVMVATGFNDVSGRMDKLDGRMDKLDGRMDKLDGRMDKLEGEMAALRSTVNNYLELSDKRYLELRQTNRTIFKYLKLVAEKAKVPLDLSELEELVR